MLTRSTRSSTRASAAASAPVAVAAAAPAPVKRRAAAAKKAPLSDVTNSAASDSPMNDDVSAPVKEKELLSFANVDLDALTAVADPVPAVAAAVAPATATTTVPAQPSLIYAQIDPEILALKVKRNIVAPVAKPVIASAAVDITPSAPAAESKRIQFNYNASGVEIGQSAVAPLPAFDDLGANNDDENDDDENDFPHAAEEDDFEDLTLLGQVERMTREAAPSEEDALPTLFHASALNKHSVSFSTSGFLPAGLVSSSAVRSVKLDLHNDAPVPACLLAAAPSTDINQVKANGFLAAGSINANKIGSKKIA